MEKMQEYNDFLGIMPDQVVEYFVIKEKRLTGKHIKRR